MSLARVRINETLGEISVLRGEIEEWEAKWDQADALGAHLSHLNLLTEVIHGLINEIYSETESLSVAISPGVVYEECRRQDQRLLHARRLWRWYADKLDQRTGPLDSAPVRALMAADEVTWSCWKAAFTNLGRPKGEIPAAPIPYMAPQFSAFATPRSEPPPDLRPGKKDDLLIKHVRELPIPVIGLPPATQRRPWWLIIAAHEASHHVQFEYPGLEDATLEAVGAAFGEEGTELAQEWLPWCRELFADACAVLLTGQAAIWAIAELEMRADLSDDPSPYYPPPLARLAVARAFADQAGLPAGTQVFPAPPTDDADKIATALLGVASKDGGQLRALAKGTDPAVIDWWREQLLGSCAPSDERDLEAARLCAAGAVAAWQQVANAGQQADDEAEWLASRALAQLPLCHAEGTRAAGQEPDAAALTRSILADLARP